MIMYIIIMQIINLVNKSLFFMGEYFIFLGAYSFCYTSFPIHYLFLVC